MKPESLAQLIASGNITTVEEEWMRLVEAPETPPARLADYQSVLAELCRVGETSKAEELAWTAVEMLAARYAPEQVLTVAGPFLLAVGESGELRAQVVGLCRSAYGDREGLDGLLAESGLDGGRPARRALRTLQVCLALTEGDFLVARHEDEAARVDKVDTSCWKYTITGREGTEVLGAVHLADRYRPAAPTEFRVARQFAPDQLGKRLWDDPVPIVIDICRQHGDHIDSDKLEAILVPDLLSESDWSKWWTRARTALRKCANVKIKGRSPYELTYDEVPVALEEEVLGAFESLHDPLAQFELVKKYLRECKARGQEPSEPALRRCFVSFTERARRLTEEGAVQAGLFWVIAYRIGQASGIQAMPKEANGLFAAATDLKAVFGQIEDEELLELACSILIEARPDDWQDHLTALLPTFPLAVCDRAAGRLIEAGRGSADFKPIVQDIMASPIEHFEALLWLWAGPSQERYIPAPAPVTLLSRILRTLDECRLSDSVPRETARKLGSRARAVLSAHKYEAFDQCLETLEAGMGSALRNQLKLVDNLGRAVQADLLSRLNRRFPPADKGKTVQPWALDDVLYVTEAGLARKQEEIDHHVNVKMKENADAIGRAASHGDLSENAEYKFALEERDLLRARLAQMNAEVAAARVISPADVPTDHVGIGTKVTFKRTTDGELYEMSFVGPWEADADKLRFNYRAPLAQKVLGKRVGDVVQFDHTGAEGCYEIVALDNALAEDE